MITILANPTVADRRGIIASLIVAFTIACVFYKFGSFALECLAFLGTWAGLDALFLGATSLVGRMSRGDNSTL